MTHEQIARAAGITVTPIEMQPVAAGRRGGVEIRHTGPLQRPVAGEIGERNPLVRAAYLTREALALQAAGRGPEPTLFAAGDLPDFTASGVDPKVLLRAPWNARQSLAAEPEAARVFAIIEKFNGLDAEEAELVAKSEGLEGAAVSAYRFAVKAWLNAGVSDDELFGLIYNDRDPRYNKGVAADAWLGASPRNRGR